MKAHHVVCVTRSRCLSLPVSLLFAVAILLNVGVSTASAAPSSVVLNIAKYAAATATHDRPAHAVTSDDVSNAVATSKVNLSLASSSSVSLVANLGDLPGYPREVMFVNSVTYMWTCVDFPDVADATPKVAPCSPQTVGAWNSEPNALNIARDAVAIAAKRGQAVSGSDVVKAAGAQRWRLATKPTFGSGLGGVVKFTNKSTSGFSGSKVTVTVNVCVQFPKTAYGIPLLVKC